MLDPTKLMTSRSTEIINMNEEGAMIIFLESLIHQIDDGADIDCLLFFHVVSDKIINAKGFIC